MTEHEPIRKEPGASVSLEFQPALPCTTQDCPNMATVGSAVYDPGLNGWTLFPLCRDCTVRLMRKYEAYPYTEEEIRRAHELEQHGITEITDIVKQALEAQEPAMRMCPHCGQHHYVKDGDFYCPLDPNKA